MGLQLRQTLASLLLAVLLIQASHLPVQGNSDDSPKAQTGGVPDRPSGDGDASQDSSGAQAPAPGASGSEGGGGGGLRGLARVEAKLARVRKRLAQKPAAGWPAAGPEDPQDHQAVYANAGWFRASYAEMEKHFRIFVYPEADMTNHMTHWGPHKDIYALDGVFFNNLYPGASKFVTRDPERASVFFLPLGIVSMVGLLWKTDEERAHHIEMYYPRRHMTSKTKMTNFAEAYVNLVQRKYPFWNQTGGRDHFLLSCNDHAPKVAVESGQELAENAIHVVCNANASEPIWGFRAGKDVSLPEVVMVPPKEPETLWNFQKFGGKPPEERTILAFYAGKPLGHHRDLLVKHWGHDQDPDMQIYETHRFAEVAARDGRDGHTVYTEHMQKARFCICPAGSEVSSPRITESIYQDCVPVIISEGFELPFWEALDWTAFSYRFSEWDIPKLKELLAAIPEEERRQKQRQLAVVRRHFSINYPPLKYDLFHMVLHSIWSRRLNLTLGGGDVRGGNGTGEGGQGSR